MTNKKTTKKVEKTDLKKEEITETVSKKGNASATVTVLVLGAIILFLVALFIPSKNNKTTDKMELTALKCENETDNITNENSKLNKVSCNGYQSLVKEEKDNIILIARPTCSYCVKYTPILEEIVDEYGITINYFDTDTLSEDETKQFYKSSSLYSSNDFGTPTLIISNNNEIKEYSIGYMEKESTINWLKENGIIAE